MGLTHVISDSPIFGVKVYKTYLEWCEETKEIKGAKGLRSICARPYAMFMSEVDTEKYPDIKRRYRFERTEGVWGNVRSCSHCSRRLYKLGCLRGQCKLKY